MNLTLREIDESNWLECIFLTTNKDDKHFVCEKFVASNALSIAQSKIEQGWITKAIYHDDTMVGFTMFGYCTKNNFYEICRLMIARKFQGKGFGRMALEIVIEQMKNNTDCKDIYLSFDTRNAVAKKLYESLGFSDMVFKPFFALYPDAEFGYLVEFKYIPKKDYSEEKRDKFVEDATNQLLKYESDDKFKKEMQLAPFGDKKVIKLIVIFSGGDMKLLKEIK